MQKKMYFSKNSEMCTLSSCVYEEPFQSWDELQAQGTNLRCCCNLPQGS